MQTTIYHSVMEIKAAFLAALITEAQALQLVTKRSGSTSAQSAVLMWKREALTK